MYEFISTCNHFSQVKLKMDKKYNALWKPSMSVGLPRQHWAIPYKKPQTLWYHTETSDNVANALIAVGKLQQNYKTTWCMSIQLSSQSNLFIPCFRLDSDITSHDRQAEPMINHSIAVCIALKHLHNKPNTRLWEDEGAIEDVKRKREENKRNNIWFVIKILIGVSHSFSYKDIFRKTSDLDHDFIN